MKYIIAFVACLVTFNMAHAEETSHCKANGQGYYGRSSVYDVVNPSAPKDCWKVRD